MWEMDNFWPGEAVNSSTNSMAHCQSSYLSIMNEIHVLVVDHDTNHLINTVHLLELCQYKVSIAELASRAIQLLLIGKTKFDFILANLNSPDLHGYKLLQQAVNMDIPLIVMSTDDSAFLTLKALENGAFLCVKKPTTMDMLKGLWLHIAREKIRISGEKNRFIGSNYNDGGIEFRDIHPANNTGGINSMLMLDKNMLHKDNYAAGISGVREGNYRNNFLVNAKVKRKVCTEWTQELHEKFMAAVRQLGEGRCFPKEILELMNVPGLTRMQVASHLQKCRNDNWRSPGERISQPNTQNVSPDHAAQQEPRRFGSMPKICIKMTTNTDSGTNAEENPNSGTGVVEVDSGIGSMVVDPPKITTNNDNNNNNNNISINAPPYRQGYGSITPHSGLGSILAPPPMRGTYSENPRNTSDEYLNFTDMDGTVQNYSARMTNTVDNDSSGGVYHLESDSRHHAQNSGAPSVDPRSHWSSEASSNAASEHDLESMGR